MTATIRVTLPAFLIVWAAGCSTFERDWENTVFESAAVSDLRGRWQGTWESAASGHTGGLRSIITRAPDGSGYLARYRATYGCCFSFEYTVPLAAEREGNRYRFEGEADLGWLAGGIYRYQGESEGNEFTSTYTSESDHGTFRMTRVP